MIGRIAGRLLEKNPPMILVDVHGVGYEIAVPMSTFYNLPEVGAETVLLTHFIVREDAQLLYGFLTAAERSAFRELIKVSGIGPRTALSVLSGLSVEALTQALTAQDSAMLTRIPGIGKKTAERLVLELKGKLGADFGGALTPAAAAKPTLFRRLWLWATPSAKPPRPHESCPRTSLFPTASARRFAAWQNS